MLKLALRNPITGVPRAREAAAQTHSCGARAEAAAQLRRNLECGERRCGDGPPQSDRGSAATEMLNPHAREAAAQTHICGGISTAGAEVRRLRNPITGVPRAREAAAQTHSCSGISTAGAQARRC